MMKNITNMSFFFTLIMGTIMSISSNSWLGAWMGLEINLLSFIPLLINLNNSLSTESALKYFMVQALASSILLFSVLLLSFYSNLLNYDKISMINWILDSSLLLKMGAAPFHFWFPEMMEGLSWFMSFVLMTWQKIAPMILISYCMIYSYLIAISMISVLFGSVGGINQISLRKLMAYSSINHLGWLICSLMISSFYWLVYFCFYSIIVMSMIYLFNYYNLFFIKQLFSLDNFNPLMKFIIFCNMLSLGGLPPFTGFLPKWIIIQSMSETNLWLINMMVIFTLITLFFYIRMMYSALMINYTELKWIKFYEYNFNKILILNFISLMMLPIISILYLIY